jgi:hypothetical protein
MGVVKASPPVGGCIGKLLLGYEILAIATLELFFGDLVVARFSEIGKLLMHRISSKECENQILLWRQGAVNPLI